MDHSRLGSLLRLLHASFGQGSNSLIECRQPDRVQASLLSRLARLREIVLEVLLDDKEYKLAPSQLSNLYRQPWPSQGATFNFNTGQVITRTEEDPVYLRVMAYPSQVVQPERVSMGS